MQTENYRKRASEVRRTARANLVQIRRARLEKRASSTTNSTVPDAIDTKELEHPGENLSVVEGPQPASVQQDISRDSIVKGTPSGVSPLAPSSGDELDELALRNAALAEIADPSPCIEEQEAHFDADPNGVFEAIGQDEKMVPDFETWQTSELAQLPGAGPGLIWMLAQCEIFTLADLACQDVRTLSMKLGVVGQILDLGQWISFALDHSNAK